MKDPGQVIRLINNGPGASLLLSFRISLLQEHYQNENKEKLKEKGHGDQNGSLLT